MSKGQRSHRSSSDAHLSHQHRGNRKRNLTPLWVGLGIVVIVVAALILLRPGSPTVSEITAAQAYEKRHAGALFVDVRTQEEWAQGHIANSTLIPLDELPDRLSELPRDRDIVVICHTGVRAKQGATILSQAGFRKVSCLTGGLQAWVDAGYPIEQ